MACASVELPYNIKTASFNPYRSDANFDGKGVSFAAELLPETIDFKGIRFDLASPEARTA